MVMNEIILCYGPNEQNGIVKFRPKLLKCLEDALKHFEFNVSIERIKPRDRLIMKLNGYKIFQCRLTFLKCSARAKIDYYNDVEKYEETTLEKAIFSAIEARTRFNLSPLKHSTVF